MTKRPKPILTAEQIRVWPLIAEAGFISDAEKVRLLRLEKQLGRPIRS